MIIPVCFVAWHRVDIDVMDAVENSVESQVKDVENSPAVTLKIRSGCEGGGKGAIWQEEKSATRSFP